MVDSENGEVLLSCYIKTEGIMSGIRSGVILTDSEFASRFIRAVAGCGRGMTFIYMDPNVFFGDRVDESDRESFTDSLDVIITDEKLSDNFEKGKLLVLTDGMTSGNSEDSSGVEDDETEGNTDSDIHRIYRYEDRRKIVSRIAYILFKRTGRISGLGAGRRHFMTAFVSASGGSGTTSLAIACAGMLDIIYGRKTLYMNLKSLDDSARYFGVEKGGGRLRLMYHLNRGVEFPIQEFIVPGEHVDRVSPSPPGRPGSDLTAAVYSNFNDSIEKLGRYDGLFLDIGTDLSDRNLFVMSQCDAVVLVERGMTHSGTGFSADMAEMIESRCSGTGLIRVSVGGNATGIEEHEWITISEDPESFTLENGRIRINLNGRYGAETAVLAGKIAEAENGPGIGGILRENEKNGGKNAFRGIGIKRR